MLVATHIKPESIADSLNYQGEFDLPPSPSAVRRFRPKIAIRHQLRILNGCAVVAMVMAAVFLLPHALQSASACVATLALFLTGTMAAMISIALMKRLAQFSRLAVDPFAEVKSNTGDELDFIASRLNDLACAQIRLQAREELESGALASLRVFLAVMNSMKDILVVTDAELSITHVNSAACAMLGCSELELIGRPIVSIFRHERSAGISAREMLLSKETEAHPISYQCMSGPLVSALVAVSTVYDNGGQVQAIITIGREVCLSARSR